MKTLAAAALALLLAASAALGEAARPKITVADALSLLAALRNLDGRAVVAKRDGVDTTVVVPWDFASGSLRMRIARAITALAAVERDTEEARKAVLTEIMAKMPPDKEGRRPTMIPGGTPEFDDFQRQIEGILRAPAAGADALPRIKVGELKLDRNEIPVTALSALSPILDDDAAPR